MLHSALLGCNFALLCFTGLHETVLRRAPLDYALFGCNCALLCLALLRATKLNYASLRCTLLHFAILFLQSYFFEPLNVRLVAFM